MHPLVGDLSGKTADELLETMSTLHNRLGAVRRSGNTNMAGQLLNQLIRLSLINAEWQRSNQQNRIPSLKTVWILANGRHELDWALVQCGSN